jgi:G:T-mismatch repair DNA endonuclease (very short patch repair protein)
MRRKLNKSRSKASLKSGVKRQKRHKEFLRSIGFKPVLVWVPEHEVKYIRVIAEELRRNAGYVSLRSQKLYREGGLFDD